MEDLQSYVDRLPLDLYTLGVSMCDRSEIVQRIAVPPLVPMPALPGS